MQARKKQQAVEQKNQEKTSTCSDSEKSTQQASSVSTASDREVDSSSDESEVSNCSDGDADDEQAILALAVVTTDAPDDKSDGDGDAVASADDDDDDDDDDNDRAAAVDGGMRDVEDGKGRFDSEPPRPHEHSGDAVDGTSSNQQQEDESVVQTLRQQDSAALSEKEDQDAGVNQSPLETDHVVNELDVARQVLDAEAQQRAEIAVQIQQFIAERTRWAMENLRAERARPVTPAPEVDDEKTARSQSPSSPTDGREALEDPPEPMDEQHNHLR
ncbi:hypothetical protein ATCC90586_011347 [Pythium insidiosum]|nr:hypothetical protein ATCC90586_011347 [Pythium insidiosum]